jgi:hypothetical protein
LCSASDETGSDPLPLSVRVALGGTNYDGVTGTNTDFARLRSSTMDIQRLALGYTLSKTMPTPGAIYQGLVVGLSGPRGVIRPVAARWPDARGRFSILLPASARGVPPRFGENQHQFVSRAPVVPGGRVDLTSWPRVLGQAVPRDFALLRVPSE